MRTREPGIYQLINTVNGKCYIGQSVHLPVRKARQSASLKGHLSWSKGKAWSEENKQKLRGRVAWNKGITGGHLAEETKSKMADAQKARRSKEREA